VNEQPGTAPKGYAASSSASAVFDNAQRARPHHFGVVVTQFEAKPFARLHAFGRGDIRSLNFGSLPGRE
jgi:hypothetical protein